MRRLIVLGLVLVLSGCLGSGETSGTGSATPTLSGAADSFGAGQGAVGGRVTDDAELFVRDARVSLLGTDFFADSNRTGHYLIANVTAGTYEMQVAAAGYMAATYNVTVVPGNLTVVDVMLLPSEQVGAGYRPHIHDYWQGLKERVIMDRDVDFRDVQKGSEFGGPPYNYAVWGAAYPSINTTMALDVPSTPEDARLIYPGTREIVITLSWDISKSTVQTVGLAYSTANGKSGKFGRLASPATFKIPIDAAEMTDRGHQWFTLWTFSVYMGTTTTSGSHEGANTRPALLYGAFHATLKVIRGEPLPEPAHVDHWEGKSQKVLLALDKSNARSSLDVVDRTVYVGPKLDSIVPPGTKKLRIFFVWEYDQLNGTAPAAPDQVLTWKTAADDPKLTRAEHYRTSAATKSGPQWKLYEIELKSADCDAFYQTTSLWKFLPATKDFEKDSRDYDPRPSKVKLEVVAFRDPAFDAAQA